MKLSPTFMNGPANTWRRHLLVVGLRLVGMGAIAVAGLLASMGANEELSGGREQAPGVAGLLFVIGVAAALIYGLLASAAHFFLRHKSLKIILLVDAILATGFIVLMAHTGTTNKSTPAQRGNVVSRPHVASS
ncbi:MAG: hypothetical protein HY300_14885 [Verrucomicrobia bacterium]|nr:hypothetical protein [Verrucomicrobiota bacterium]